MDRVYATGTVEDRERPGRPSKITEQTIDEIRDVIQDEPQLSVCAVLQQLVLFHWQQHIE